MTERTSIVERKQMILSRLEVLKKTISDRLGSRYPDRALYPSNMRISFNLRGAKAGTASQSGEIRLNIDMVAGESFSNMMNEILPHEFAHIVCFKLGLDYGHGKNWKAVARMLGCSGARCHSESVKYARGRTFEYVTTLGARFVISETRHKRVQRGGSYIIRGKGRIDKTCSYKMVA